MPTIYNGTLYNYQAIPDRIYFQLNMGGLTGSAPTNSGWTAMWMDPVSFSALTTDIEYGQLGSSGVGFRAVNDGGTNTWGVLNSTALGGAGVNVTGGIYPKEVMEQYWFTNSTTGTILLYDFSGSGVLTPDKSFTFRFFGSRGGITPPRRTIYSIGLRTASLEVSNNSSSYVDITDIVPSASTITIKVRNTVADSTFGYLNAMLIIEDTKVIPTELGNIFTETSFASTSDFPITGTGITRGSNKLDLTGNPTLFTSYVYYNSTSSAHRYTGLEMWKHRVRVKTSTTLNSTSYGLGIGVQSANTWQQYSTTLRWSWDTGGPGAQGSIYLYNVSSTSGQIISTTNYVPTANTYYWVEVERSASIFSYNIYDSAGTTLLFTASVSFSISASGNYSQAHNVGQFCIHQFGGTANEVTNWEVSSKALKNAKYLVVGDSNTYGLFASSNRQRWAENALVSQSRTFNISAGISDRTNDVILKLPELKALAPKNVILSIGRNDLASGSSLAAVTSSINTIISELENAGIRVKLGGVIASTVDVSGLQTYYTSKTSNEQVNFYTATKGAGTTMTSSYDSGDAIHLNPSGNALLSALIQNII